MTGGGARCDRTPEHGQRVLALLRPRDVDDAASQRAGTPAEEHPQRPAKDPDEHPDQTAGGRPHESDVLGALDDPKLTLRSALGDRRSTEFDPAFGVRLLQHAQRLVRLARLFKADNHHIVGASHGCLPSIRHVPVVNRSCLSRALRGTPQFAAQ